jgi:hypothetical protein
MQNRLRRSECNGKPFGLPLLDRSEAAQRMMVQTPVVVSQKPPTHPFTTQLGAQAPALQVPEVMFPDVQVPPFGPAAVVQPAATHTATRQAVAPQL